MSRVELYVHAVWATWERRPLIAPEIEPRLHATIAAKCIQLRCAAIAIGGVEDHVHLLARLHPSVAIAALIGQVKGLSSYVTHELGAQLRWQDRYGALTVSPDDVPTIERYIQQQRLHHRYDRLVPEFELPAI